MKTATLSFTLEQWSHIYLSLLNTEVQAARNGDREIHRAVSGLRVFIEGYFEFETPEAYAELLDERNGQ